MTTVPRISQIPGTRPLLFQDVNNPHFGMINLIPQGLDQEINQIAQADELVISVPRIKVFFPIYDQFYVKEYRSMSGFTFRALVQKIMKCASQAGKEVSSDFPEDFPTTFAITSSGQNSPPRSDLEIRFDLVEPLAEIYVSVQD